METVKYLLFKFLSLFIYFFFPAHLHHAVDRLRLGMELPAVILISCKYIEFRIYCFIPSANCLGGFLMRSNLSSTFTHLALFT